MSIAPLGLLFQASDLRCEDTIEGLGASDVFCSLASLHPSPSCRAMGGYERLSISEGSSSSSLVDEEDWTPPSRSERTGLVQQRNFLAILAIVLALALGVQSVRHHAPPPLPASRPPAASPTPSTPRVSSQQDAAVGASRPYAGLARGHWSPPSRAWTKQDVLHQWGAPAQGNVGSANKARLEQLSAWEWKPEMAIREWESFEFIKRCMNSEKGLLLVGGERWH